MRGKGAYRNIYHRFYSQYQDKNPANSGGREREREREREKERAEAPQNTLIVLVSGDY